jgi:N-methylhydantoinase A
MTYKIGIDVGGTFTDLVAVDEDTGRFITAKAPSTPEDQSSGLMEAVAATGIAGKDITSIIHGCTVAINAVLTRTGVKTGLLTTDGFRDVLVMGRGQRPSSAQFDPRWRRSISDSMQPLVPRYLRRTVSERVDCDGRVFIPLNTEDAERELAFLSKCGIEALAIFLLNS